MRVITGTARGRRLEAPAGEATRPTASHIKESIFNIVQFDIEGRRVLDLFAGTGQLGIEALSRGAREAVFVDASDAAVKVIRKNLDHTGLEGGAQVVRGDYDTYLAGNPGKFDLVFMDPPYHGNLVAKSLQKMMGIDILRLGGIIICEASKEARPPELLNGYRLKKQYRYGVRTLLCIVREDLEGKDG